MSAGFPIAVTGASGFVGRALCLSLAARGHGVRALVRRADALVAAGEKCVVDFAQGQELVAALRDVQVVVHLAARVHVMNLQSGDVTAFHAVNVELSMQLARAAVEAGVRRFIYVSTIKVLGEGGTARPLVAADAPQPAEPYGHSKWEAEMQLAQICAQSGMELVIIRPPLVYGPDVRANFAALIKLAALPLPLPFAAVHNRRDMVSVKNLCDLIIRCLDHPAAAGQTFLVSDGRPYSTTELLTELRAAMNKPRWLFPVPPSLLAYVFAVLGKKSWGERLLGNFEIDISDTCERLQWRPPQTLPQALCDMLGQVKS